MAKSSHKKVEMSVEDKALAIDLFANDIQKFGEWFFPHLLTKKSPPFHSEVFRLLYEGHHNIAIGAPRGHAKTTAFDIIFPIWWALHIKVGNVAIYSASEDFVLREITGVIKKEFERNKDLIEFYGSMKTAKWTESYFVLKNGISFEGGGITGQLRGGRKGLICLDDLETIDTVGSEDQRDKLKQRVLKEVLPKLLPDGQLLMTGTLIHQLCFLKSVLDGGGKDWVKRTYKAYRDGREEPGFELWPEMYNHEWLQEKKRLQGSNYFQCEFMNNPVSDETAPIKESQIKTWETMPSQITSVIAVDPAYGEDNKSDYKVASIVSVDAYGRRYLSTYVRTHESLGTFYNSIINLWLQNRDHVTAVGIPNSGVEKSFFDSFMKKCEERKVYPPVVELKNSFTQSGTSISVRNKKSRIIAALQPLFEAGKYYIGCNHHEAREELLMIGQSQHDDVVDTLAYAEQLLQTYYQPPQERQWSELGEIEEPVTSDSYGY